MLELVVRGTVVYLALVGAMRTVVHRAYIEPNGMVSVIRRDAAEVDAPPRPPSP